MHLSLCKIIAINSLNHCYSICYSLEKMSQNPSERSNCSLDTPKESTLIDERINPYREQERNFNTSDSQNFASG